MAETRQRLGALAHSTRPAQPGTFRVYIQLSMPVTLEEAVKYREFVRAIALENGCLDFQPDQIIWHYTNASGFLGILQSSKIYATQISALNDEKETRHASELFLRACRELIEERGAVRREVEFLNSVVSYLEENAEAHARSKFFVTCFSGQEDDLSQWERYGKKGYAIGFRAGGLQREINSTLFRVIYDAEKHRQAARKLAEATVDFYFEGLTGERLNDPAQWVKDFLLGWDEWVYRLAPLAKAEHWRAENEYRIVHELKVSELPLVRFSEKETMIARYIALDTPLVSARRCPLLPIAKICIGPGNNFEVTKVSIGLLLDQMGYPVVPIQTSAVTLRHP